MGIAIKCFQFVGVLVACSIAIAKSGYRGRFTREVKDYDIVVPKKVSADGAFVSYHLPHYYNVARVKRGADSGRVHYVLPIRGEDKILDLWPTEDFYAPGMVFEHHERDVRANINSVKMRKPLPRRCYYQGWIRDEPASSAAIASCSGLAGSITIGSEQFLIEPVDDEGKPTVDNKHKHLLYKRSYEKLMRNYTCGNNEDSRTAFNDRMKWEKKYGKATEESMKGPWSQDGFQINSSTEIPHDAHGRPKRWCNTCLPRDMPKCLTPHTPCIIDRPLYVELLLVVGPRVAIESYIENDIQQFVNTIINIVVRNFQDASLGRPILVKLVRTITMGYLDEDLDPEKNNPQLVLHNFCDWQMHFNPRMEDHPNHHDFAIYLVKMDPCEGTILGLTNMASMCRPDKSCAVVSEQGLLTGPIITHMLGHSLGADHDDSSTTSCAATEPDGTHYHMGPHITGLSTAWSSCSKNIILQFVKTHAGWCLTDIPSAADLTEPVVLPGQVYSAAEQCRINFEANTYACIVGPFCKRLYCKISDEECVSLGDPPAQGTRCGPNMWCFNEECVHRGTRPGAINGEWGEWTPWSHCTKTCGGGIQSAHRSCDSPSPSKGGKLCLGPWMKSKMCNVGSCPDAGKGFLDIQCKLTNDILYKGRKHEWLYFNQQIEDLQCVVVCVNEQNQVAVRSPLAMDGTYCKPGYKDVCIRGACKKVGCDWVIGSNAKEDACGICHGNGTECRIMQGYFSDKNVKGKVEFLKLPIGTSMVLIRETRPSECFFMISDSLNGSYYLNSELEEQLFFTGTFVIGNTIGVYQLKGDMERIFIKEPLAVPITISSICYHEEVMMGILYQYALPEPNNPASVPTYTWEFLSWEKCPYPCGGGAQRSIAVCVEAQGGEVEDCYCSQQTKPPDKVRVCNRHPCQAKWWVGPWARCDCLHEEGTSTRMVMCAKLKEPRSGYIVIVAEEECSKETKPRTEKSCDPLKEQQMWEKKDNPKKRDLTDIIPYSDLAEEYTVWDDVSEDKFPVMVNVRSMIQKIDPESVHDYAYLKRIGMTPRVWEKIHSPAKNDSPRQRKRVKRHKPTKTHRNHRRRKSHITTSIETTTDEIPTTTHQLTTHQLVTTVKLMTTSASTIHETTQKITETTHVLTETPTTDQVMASELKKKINATKTESPTETYPYTTGGSASGGENTEAMEDEENVKKDEKSVRKEVSGGTTLDASTRKKTTVKPLGTTRSGRTLPTLPSGKKVLNNLMTQSAVRAVSRGLNRKGGDNSDASCPLTDTELDDISMCSSDSPTPPDKKHWRKIMKPAMSEAPCNKDGTPEPADGEPEIDFWNTSAIKIYVVPIMTTIRTIIQNDQEYVMMETLAKYPIGDEMQAVEHWGDSAEREMRLIKDRVRTQTKSPSIED